MPLQHSTQTQEKNYTMLFEHKHFVHIIKKVGYFYPSLTKRKRKEISSLTL